MSKIQQSIEKLGEFHEALMEGMKTRDKLEAERKVLLSQLKKKYQIESIDEAKKVLKALKKVTEELEQKIIDKVEEIENEYFETAD